ncbi:filamentous haemagglutinin family protein [Achromobacter xylosoxidans]|uniref:filamentous haemagglutinin family protein n=1 Tax=Alcaligenes xylosoxydans xylosoxydans TaxID=85698 RepID=UPI001EEE9C40|nr:filamentous haemagglutinin family protein [Achromobacter xylosoxidans]
MQTRLAHRGGRALRARKAGRGRPRWRPTQVSQALAVLLVAGGWSGAAQAQARAFSPAWFADKGAVQSTAQRTGRMPDGSLAGIGNSARQQAQSRQQLQRSLDNLNRTAAAVAAQQAAQAAARAAAAANGTAVPDGLAPGGLWIAEGAQAKWEGANKPRTGTEGGRQLVTIEQTQSRAILNWDTFNVGRNTTLRFQQKADDAVLNRVVGASARPSQIQGAIQADGTVLVVNQNGVIFSGTSQVNARNLVVAAATMSDAQFRGNGLYGDNGQPTFRDAAGRIEVQAGARLQTSTPASSTTGGGYVLLLGKEAVNAGTIDTPGGQAQLAAGDSFVIKRGQGTAGNQLSTTRGNEVTPAGATGRVENTGLIQAALGDVTLTGAEVAQRGVLLSSTSVNARGTLHLAAAGADGRITLAAGSATAILLDRGGDLALDSQRDGLRVPLGAQTDAPMAAAGSDRRDLSRVEIRSGGTVDFAADSMTLATGGQIVVHAARRSLLRDGAVLDVAGAVGVPVAMENNNIKINVQGNEQRDAPLNRDSGKLNSSDVWVDLRELVWVPAGTNGYATDRWYTAGGLLEVSGYLGTRPHAVGEWMAQGGNVEFSGGDVVTRAGSSINLSGGTLDVQDGMIRQSWLRGADGRLYEVSRAPGDLAYAGLYLGYEARSARWGQTRYFYNPLLAPRERFETGYTVGRDAGRLLVGTSGAVLEGELLGATFLGERQSVAARSDLDGYQQSQRAAARGAQLVVGAYTPYYDKRTGALRYTLERNQNTAARVVLDGWVAAIAGGLELDTALPADRGANLLLDSARLSASGLGAVRIAAADIDARADLTVAPGGEITLFAERVSVDATLSARGGALRLGSVMTQATPTGMLDTLAGGNGADERVALGANARLDASGLWRNLAPAQAGALAYLDGGSVSVRGRGDLLLDAGSTIDVGSGAALRAPGKLTGGRGGDITLETLAADGSAGGRLRLAADLRGYGVEGGGTLAVTAPKVVLGDAGAAGDGALVLEAALFQRGFSRYQIAGSEGLAVADDARIDVAMPVYRPGADAAEVPTGSRPAVALQAWLPPVYQHDPVAATITRRRGASLSLQSGRNLATAGADVDAALTIGRGARVTVDPGQTLRLRGAGQITVLGALSAAAGRIDIRQLRLGDIDVAESVETASGRVHDRSILVGEQALLDVAGRAEAGVDARGRRYGVADQGGAIVIGGEIDHERATATSSDAYVIVRPGARLEASGASVDLDVQGVGPLRLDRDGGRISLSSYLGLQLDGQLAARAGGPGAAGGTLDIALETPLYRLWGGDTATAAVQVPRELVLTSGAAAREPRYGQARLDLARVLAGAGFDHIGLLSNGLMSFDGAVDLAAAGSLRLYAGAFSLATGADAADSRVMLSAPYVRLSGPGRYFATNGLTRPRVLFGDAATVGAGNFTVRAGGLLEVGNSLSFGTQGQIQVAGATPLVVTRPGFDRVELRSGGDMRFLAPNDDQPRTRLWTRGDLDLVAAQLYPATGADAEVLAGHTRDLASGALVFDPARTLRVGRVDAAAALPPVPYSAFGTLRLAAASVEQGGVLRAPLGAIVLGDLSERLGTRRLTLLPGSVTSVSGAGLVMPYGGTSDGVSYRFQGEEVALVGVGGATGFEQGAYLRTGITLAFRDVDAAPGALLDLSGGGELAGAGFVSGRGGSTDARYFPLVRNTPDGGFFLPALADHPVYAIVPGAQPGYAPAGGEAGASRPGVGRQITVGAGVPGLPAGTYTLMPSTFALLPGAFRVEINGAAAAGPAIAPMRLRNLSWAASGTLSTAGTALADSLPSQVILTPAAVLRTYSQYNETSYASFVRADAVRRGVPRAMLPADARTLRLTIFPGTSDGQALRFDGVADFRAAAGGFAGTAALNGGSSQVEILPAGQAPSAGFGGASVQADALAALGANRLVIGALPVVEYGQGGRFYTFQGGAQRVILRSGAQLATPEILVSSREIEVEAGAGLSTLGRGAPSVDSTQGYAFQPGAVALLALSNGRLDVLAPDAQAAGSIRIGTCAAVPCPSATGLYSEGTIAAAVNGVFDLGEAVRYGTRNLTLAVGAVNVGTATALEQAAARGVLPSGLTLNQEILARLLRGDVSSGAPGLEVLTLTARDAINFYGSVALDTRDPASGRYSLATLALGTPALYGYGESGDEAAIRTGHLVWNGATQAPGAVAAGGAGTGRGTLRIDAERIEFGYGQGAQPNGVDDNARLALGFGAVVLNASERVTANHRGSLAVYQSQGAYGSGGYAYSGGDLTVNTPLLTGVAGSVNRFIAGGDVRVVAPAGAPVAPVQALGAELSLTGANVRIGGAIVLPSGKLTLTGRDSVLLGAGSTLDLAGRAIAFNDVWRYSWGGELILESGLGAIRQESGALIDLSARENDAGALRAVALSPTGGEVALLGRILGGASGRYDAAGTLVPYRAGSIDIRAQRLGAAGSLDADFDALNQRLNEGGVSGARSFQIKQGNLTVGDALRANDINLSLDGGHLTVAGRVDASGERVGRIRLAAREGLTLASGAVLDAHGTLLRVDSYGKIIDAPNRAVVELNAGQGVLTLAGGARIDLRHGTAATQGTAAGQHDGAARGTLELLAPRVDAAGNAGINGGGAPDAAATYGDIAIEARGPLAIEGAKAITLIATQRYDDARPGDPAERSGGREYQIIDQDYLNEKHADSAAFMGRALANGNLLGGKLAGLNNAVYRDVFHLRPGVEIVSRSADGDLVVQGDLDLSGYRYASLNPRTPLGAAYGSGEAGALVLRAKGNLDVYGSINDGFAPPPASPDDENGWILTPGTQPFGGDVVLPRGGVELAEGTEFPGGRTLNYPLPLQATTLAAGTRLPVEAVLDQSLSLAPGTVVSGDVRDAAGQLLYGAGTVLAQAVELPAGTRLGAGTLLAQGTALQAFTWPADVALPNLHTTQGNEANVLRLAGTITLKLGALIPSQAKLMLPAGTEYVPLRPDATAAQRRNWALAPMLPAGSQSWSVQLVAGADLEAADPRRVLPGAGHLTLADSHYNVSLEQGNARLVWGPDAPDYGAEPGKPVPDEMQWLCDVTPGLCVPPPPWVWAEDNWLGFPGGEPVADGDLALCKTFPDQCVANKTTLTIVNHTQNFSVLRTGTGDLALAAGGDISLRSAYGVYTAGTQAADVAPAYLLSRGRYGGTVLGDAYASTYEPFVADGAYQAWYPEAGGNLDLYAGGALRGDVWGRTVPASLEGRVIDPSVGVGNWLWRQGTGSANGGDTPTAWWINFGSYTQAPASFKDGTPLLAGFTGFGALGGGNVSVRADGDAGNIDARGTASDPRSQGLVVAVGSTGRVAADGALALTGGGDIDVRIGGRLNPTQNARGLVSTTTGAKPFYGDPALDLQGALINLRGSVRLSAGAVGGLALQYGNNATLQDAKESRGYDPYTSTLASATGGLVLMPGDAVMRVDTRGDLVLGGAGDPGRVAVPNSTPFRLPDGTALAGGGYSWFSMWTDSTAIELASAGGNLAPSRQTAHSARNSPLQTGRNTSASDARYLYPSILRATAYDGSVYAGASAGYLNSEIDGVPYSLTLAPGARGQLELLAGDSIYAGGYAINRSGADPTVMASVRNPAFAGYDSLASDAVLLGNQGAGGGAATRGIHYPLFHFGAPTAGAAGSNAVTRLYARDGDIVGLRSGELISVAQGPQAGLNWFEAAGPVWMMAGRDIVASGTDIGKPTAVPTSNGYTFGIGDGVSSGNLFLHRDGLDVSRVAAGRDILYSTFQVAGPGVLEVTAGRHVLMADRAAIGSLGPVLPGDPRPGASIAVQAGVGAAGPDYAGFLARYLDPARLADAGRPREDQGLPFKTYEAELLLWLTQRYGFAGSGEQARAYFDALPAEQQRIFARQVYFAELRAGGREYNDKSGPRSASYLRGRQAIAALFPDTAPGAYQGDLTLYGAAGIRTAFGGDIQLLTPGGQQVFGVEGAAPPATAGIITQGEGDIQLYALGSILLGQSRVMTTFGGGITAWSAQGDINAGRGSKTSVLYTPPKRVYDSVGNVTLSPAAPSTGAGIATLAPLPEVPAGDVDLYAPLGTIDAGEAGIRVSGNVNIAALQVVNAANIQAQGDSQGVPVAAAANTGALASASAAASSAVNAAQDSVQRAQSQARRNLPSVITVQILGHGDEPLAGASRPAAPGPATGYDAASAVQVLGAGTLDDSEMRALSPIEKSRLAM